MAEYDDHIFRDKLKEAEIEWYGSISYGFAEDSLAKYQNYAVDQNGDKFKKTDWYIGCCPTCDEYNQERFGLVEKSMQELKLDGFFLGFMRYPGFWELWLPGTDGEKWKDYCYCSRCIIKFQEFSGIKIPNNLTVSNGQWIKENAKDEWVKFKCKNIHDIIENFRNITKKYNSEAKIVLNTVPFDKGHYEDYGREIFGQDPKTLSDVVDIFEVMGYHQILGQPYNWIREAGEYFKKTTKKKVVCTVQGEALYTKGMHKNKGRMEHISSDEFRNALFSIADSDDIDGTVVFTWSDFLRQEFEEDNIEFLKIVNPLNNRNKNS